MSQLALELIAKEKIEKTGILDLGNCGLTEIPKQVFDLKWLNTLNLSNYYVIDDYNFIETKNSGEGNKISEIPKEIKRLSGLKSFSANNQNISKIENLRYLKKLEILLLENNQIKDISSLKSLENLLFLELNLNLITFFPKMKSKKLNHLFLIGNKISTFEHVIDDLPELRVLCLDENKIKDISFLKTMNTWTYVDLKYNKIEDISPLYDLMVNKNIRVGFEYALDNSATGRNNLTLFQNPLKNPPIEIVRQGTKAIVDYFDQLTVQGEDYLFEAKMIILGESGAGKTTFFRKIKDNQADLPKDEETTLGINTEPWLFEISPDDISKAINKPLKNEKAVKEIEKKGFNVNRWDFGGQEIYHSTHQFFLSHRSFYVLLADTREQKTDFNYWLNIAEQRSGDSPLIVVLNEKHGHTWTIDEYGYKTRFPFYKETHSLNLAEPKDFTKLEVLRQKVQEYVLKLPHIGDILPASWVEIRLELSRLDNKYISLDKFIEICKQHGMKALDKILSMSQYFHDIGVFIHFQKNPILKNRIFLDANWTTETIYDLLNDEKIKDNFGRFDREYVQEIWNDDDCILIIDELLELLEEFGLAYPINTNDFIFPQRLSPAKPYDKWRYEAEPIQLLFSYTFDNFMPKGLISRLIVALHEYIYDQTLVWLKGVNLKREEAFAEIIEEYGTVNRFNIRIIGNNKRDLLITIKNAFDKILKDYPKLKYEQLIPCNCDECKNQTSFNKKSFYDYEKLNERLNKRKMTIECNQTYEDVQIEPMLYDVFGKSKESTNIEKELSRLGKRDKDTFKQMVEAWLPNYNKLASGGFEYLIEADAEYDNTLKNTSDNFHSFIQQYCVAIENEFKALYTDYHKDIRNRISKQADIDTLTSGNTGHGNFAKYVKSDNVKKYNTFDEMISILKKSNTETSDLFKDFNDFLLSKYDISILLDNRLLDDVDDIRGNHRNNTAHPNSIIFNRLEADAFKNKARKIIQKLVDAKL